MPKSLTHAPRLQTSSKNVLGEPFNRGSTYETEMMSKLNIEEKGSTASGSATAITNAGSHTSHSTDAETSSEIGHESEKPHVMNREVALTKIQGSAHEGTGTSISSQIQKIIAKELTAPYRKGKVDLQSVPMKEYLENTVIPIVHQGMIALARERPDSPIEYLAALFLKHKNRYLHADNENNLFRVQTEQNVTGAGMGPGAGLSSQNAGLGAESSKASSGKDRV